MLAAAFALLYFAAVKLGSLTLMAEGLAIVWLPNGFLLGFLLRFPARTPALLAAAFVAELAAGFPTFGMIEAVAFALINIGEVMMARALLYRWKFANDFSNITDLPKFLLAAPGVSALVAAACGAAVYSTFRGGQTTYQEFFRIWWFGDGLGLILATPLVLAIGRERAVAGVTRADLMICAAGLLSVVLLSFTEGGQLAGVHLGPIVLLPFVVYAATRFHLAVATGVVTVAAIIVVTMTALGRNPFGHQTVFEAVVHAQEFLGVLGIVSVGLVAGMNQLRRAREQVEMANATLELRVLERTQELENALAQVRSLSGLLPMCAWCRKLRDDEHYWHSLEDYISRETDAKLTHGICPQCAAELERTNAAPGERDPP